ncbi:MAG: hypothetical protein M1536_01740, partial [Firmicutes bacterium]|nr:hypothetical protein [Bacillota bacterium]
MKTSKKRNIQKAEKYYDKGVEYGTVGKFEAAKAEFKKALNVDPSYVPAKNSLMIIKDLTDNKIKNKTFV